METVYPINLLQNLIAIFAQTSEPRTAATVTNELRALSIYRYTFCIHRRKALVSPTQYRSLRYIPELACDDEVDSVDYSVVSHPSSTS